MYHTFILIEIQLTNLNITVKWTYDLTFACDLATLQQQQQQQLKQQQQQQQQLNDGLLANNMIKDNGSNGPMT